MSNNPPMPNRSTKLYSYNSSASSSQGAFDGAVDGTSDGGNYWATVSKKAKSFNTYPCSLRSSTKLIIEDMNLRLGYVYSVNNAVTGATHDMDPNYGSFLY